MSITPTCTTTSGRPSRRTSTLLPFGRVEIKGSTFTGNGAGDGGAAINNVSGGTITISHGSVDHPEPRPDQARPARPGGVRPRRSVGLPDRRERDLEPGEVGSRRHDQDLRLDRLEECRRGQRRRHLELGRQHRHDRERLDDHARTGPAPRAAVSSPRAARSPSRAARSRRTRRRTAAAFTAAVTSRSTGSAAASRSGTRRSSRTRPRRAAASSTTATRSSSSPTRSLTKNHSSDHGAAIATSGLSSMNLARVEVDRQRVVRRGRRRLDAQRARDDDRGLALHRERRRRAVHRRRRHAERRRRRRRRPAHRRRPGRRSCGRRSTRTPPPTRAAASRSTTSATSCSATARSRTTAPSTAAASRTAPTGSPSNG